MDERDREEEARLHEIRARARELQNPEDRATPRRDPGESRGPNVQTWRPAGRGRAAGPRDFGRYQYGSGSGGYPGSASYPLYMGGTYPPGYPPMTGGYPERGRRWSPPAHRLHRDGTLIVRFDLPGIDRKDVEVRVEGRKLIVEGERADDRPESGGWSTDWGYGPFRGEVELPRPVDASQIRARYRNGCLDVAVPEPRPEERRKRVEVEAA